MEDAARPAHGEPMRLTEKRFMDRIVALSDGVAAIAITLLVLPLVELEAPDVAHGESVWDALRDNSDALLAFAITFLVIASLWFAHARVFGFMARADAFVAWANVCYLLAVVFLPFSSSWLQDDGFEAGVGTLYFLSLFLASASLTAIGSHLRRHPELQTEEARADPAVHTTRGSFFAVYFLLGAVLSWWLPTFAGWYLMALWPAAVLWERWDDRHRAHRQRAA